MISDATTFFLVGIKGVAMASLAQCLADMGKQVQGCDVAEDFVTKEVLRRGGFSITVGFDPSLLPQDCDLVVYTGAHQGKHNPLVREAQSRGIQVMSHAEALGMLMEGKRAISVCGTGGKSTTSAMIAWILSVAGHDPSYSVGVGNIPNLSRTGHIGRGDWFVVEADEYAVDPTDDHRPRFIYQHPEVIVCTNLSYDHPDIYPTFDAMKQTFAEFFSRLPENGALILNQEQTLVELAASLSIPNITFLQEDDEIVLKIPGEHNRRNAQAALLACQQVGIDRQTILGALASFSGTMRRFEDRGISDGLLCFDDYAHTPDEIKATITALREWKPGKKIIVAFQPHTYSRTKALFDGFVDALSLADDILVLDIFASAREAEDRTISSQMIVDALGQRAKRIPTIADLRAYMPTIRDREQSVFMTMGAGNIYEVYDHT